MCRASCSCKALSACPRKEDKVETEAERVAALLSGAPTCKIRYITGELLILVHKKFQSATVTVPTDVHDFISVRGNKYCSQPTGDGWWYAEHPSIFCRIKVQKGDIASVTYK